MGLFDFWVNKKTVDDNETTKNRGRRTNSVDMSEAYSVNSALTRGLYHNTYPGLRQAGSLAFPIISVPVFFMGIPTPIHENEKANEKLKKLVEQFQSEMQQIHIQSHREGTVWIWPKFDSVSRKIAWEFIPDDSVTDIVKDISSGRIIAIWTDEQITVRTGFNETKIVNRTRKFTESTVEVKYTGADGIPGELLSATMRNPAGIIPVPFSNNADGSEIRGHSDYERLIADFKSYNDIAKSELEILAKYSPKLNIQVQDVDKWMNDNGYGDIGDIDVSSSDLFFTLYGKEKIELIESGRLTDGHRQALERLFLKMVESSAVPEIVWGPSVSGNYASSADAMTTLVKYVKDKQNQKNEAYTALWNGTLAIRNQVEMDAIPGSVKIKWNDLDSVSDETKVRIFQTFAAGISQLISSAGATPEQIHLLWQSQFPKATPDDFNEFMAGLDKMARHKQFAAATYADALGMEGKGGQDEIDKLLAGNDEEKDKQGK